MKKITRNFSVHLDPVILYIEDIKSILDVLHQLNAKIELATIDAKYDNLEELLQNEPKLIYFLQITCREPYISIDLKGYEVWLYIAEDNLISRGAFEKIKTILNSRKRRFWKIINNSAVNGLLIGTILSVTTFQIKRIIENKIFLTQILLPASLLILMIIGNIYTHNISVSKYSTIQLINKENKNFFNRNKDNLLLSIISGIIGVISGFILARIG
jgi:hypothetical protein